MGPITDAFGTLLSADALLDGVRGQGLEGARLILTDDGVILEHGDPDPRSERVARAVTHLRTRLSPLVPVQTRTTSEGPPFEDRRTRAIATVDVVEIFDPDDDGASKLRWLLERVGLAAAPEREETPGAIATPDLGGEPFATILGGVAAEMGVAVARCGIDPGRVSFTAILPGRSGLAPRSVEGTAASELHLLSWLRPGGATGVRRALLVALSRDRGAIRWLAEALCDEHLAHEPPAAIPDVRIDGLVWGVARRPTFAAPSGGPAPASPIRVDPDRCTSCGICEAMCPTDFLGAEGLPRTPAPEDALGCIRCYECVEACPEDALRPVHADDTGLLARTLAHRPGWLARAAGARGPALPAPFPPSFLLPRDDAGSAEPRRVLGLAVMTMQEHAAVLVEDGAVVGAVELERVVRERHAGWHPPGRPGVTAAVDPTIPIEETFCRPAIRALLDERGLTLDDVDLFAINGLHGRMRNAFSFLDAETPIPTLTAGRVTYVPHHLAHAASTYRVTDLESAWILTVDGRGDRECGAIFRAENGEIVTRETILALTDHSIGGVYEGVTRLLGFGTHGQGSVMALASFGEPTDDLSPFLSQDEAGALVVHESGIDEAFADRRRDFGAPLSKEHHALAASLQAALEATVLGFMTRVTGGGPLDALCLAGGVVLNCRMNNRLRRALEPGRIFAQPAANDAGTALGAAAEAWYRHGGAPKLASMEHSYLGPAPDEAEMRRALERSGLAYRRVDDVAEEAASRLIAGQVLCWFQGAMELGPRALGARSIVADPRDAAIKDRVNGIKERQPWRPFGPSILAGHEDEWFEAGFDSRFMLFTLPVREDKRAAVPAIVHVDGSTRPQSVHAAHSPRYHAMIAAFHAKTGVPMVLNTSFNRRGEPIVCTAEDAIESFLGLGADALVLGDFIVEHPDRVPRPARAEPDDAELAPLGGGRRLSLRLTGECDWDCVHCTMRDQPRRPDRSFEATLHALADGRRAGCDELVVMRGEATLRSDLVPLLARARAMGYRFVQLQTNAAALGSPRASGLIDLVDAFEVTALAPNEALHDTLSRAPGSWRPFVKGLRALCAAGKDVLLSVPVLRANQRALGGMINLAKSVGVRRVQLVFVRPVESRHGAVPEALPRLSEAAAYVEKVAEVAQQLGITLSTEGFPHCALPPSLRGGPDATEDFRRHRVHDLHVLHESTDDVRARGRPEAPVCRGCSARDSCPRTWAAYLELYGSGELAAL